jgi:hypothetical protein
MEKLEVLNSVTQVLYFLYRPSFSKFTERRLQISNRVVRILGQVRVLRSAGRACL